MKRASLFALILSASVAAGATEAVAQTWGFPGYGFDGPAWFGPYRNLYGQARVPVPPYYALHPPVYYSHPVARPYGTSPFACPCQHTDDAAPVESEVIENPHLPPPVETQEPAALRQTARVIWNPFFDEKEQFVRTQE